MLGGATAGTAGRIFCLPFTGDIELLFPCCVGAEPPTATGGLLDAIGGGENVFLVALAYDRAAGCDPGPEGDVVPEADDEATGADWAALAGFEAGWIVLLIRAWYGLVVETVVKV